MRRRRIELLSHPWQGRVLPLNQHRIAFHKKHSNIKIYFFQKILKNYQLIISILCSFKYLLVFENGFEPKNPLFAEKGDG